MDWKDVNKEKPYCWESGDWDGKKSHIVLCIDVDGNYHLAQCYKGFMDGFSFFDWYDKSDFEIKSEITHWMELSNPTQ